MCSPILSLYKYPLFIKKGYKKADCPNTETFFNRMISFPFHHWMSSSDFNKMIKITNHLIAKFKRNNVKKIIIKELNQILKKIINLYLIYGFMDQLTTRYQI